MTGILAQVPQKDFDANVLPWFPKKAPHNTTPRPTAPHRTAHTYIHPSIHTHIHENQNYNKRLTLIHGNRWKVDNLPGPSVGSNWVRVGLQPADVDDRVSKASCCWHYKWLQRILMQTLQMVWEDHDEEILMQRSSNRNLAQAFRVPTRSWYKCWRAKWDRDLARVVPKHPTHRWHGDFAQNMARVPKKKLM